ncbi:radical SAM protein [Adlercreutzia equolifaciens]|uniref:radical SAM protein n=1 Tax=Adlercreutzia equolifaciens TaxID=446660 RepID=UPI003521B0DF
MHYTGTIWRPPYEADSLILEATAGCTHRACKFCTLYDELPFKFKVSELPTMESDLLEAQAWFHDPLSKIETRLFGLPAPKHCRVFLAGANPFALKAKRLIEISDLIREYFPSCKTIGCFARVTDVASKTDDELAALREAGYTGLTIGIETGDDAALAFMNKGYAAQDIVAQCARLDAADIAYAFFYLAGISGKGRGIEGARLTTAACNQTRPSLIGANMLTIYKNSELYQEILDGNWEEETEIEKYQEIKALVEGLEIPVEFAMLGASNPVMLQGRLPEQRGQLLAALESIINDIGEYRLRSYRTNLRHL